MGDRLVGVAPTGLSPLSLEPRAQALGSYRPDKDTEQ